MAKTPGPPSAGPLTGPIYTRHDDHLNVTQELRALWARINQVTADASPSPKEPPEPPEPPPPPGGLQMWFTTYQHRSLNNDPWTEVIPILRFGANTSYVFLEARCVMHYHLGLNPDLGPTWEISGVNDRRGHFRQVPEAPWPTLDPALFAFPQRLPSMDTVNGYPATLSVQHLVGYHSPRWINGTHGEYEPEQGNNSMGPDMYKVNICPTGDTVNITLRKGQKDPCFLAVFYGFYFVTSAQPGLTADGGCPIW